MRAYDAASEEALHIRNQLKDWAGEGFVDPAQYKLMEEDTPCELRRTNIFLRLVLFFFTSIIVGAAVGLFFVIFVSHPSDGQTGALFLFFAAVAYGAAEMAVSQAKLYRYGVEESLLVCSMGFLCVGLELTFFGTGFHSGWAESLVPLAATIASLWIWRRFGLHYMFLIAMIFAAVVAYRWTSSPVALHVVVCFLYAGGLFALASQRVRYSLTHLRDEFSVAEALLWGGLYLAINLQLSSAPLLAGWWSREPTANVFGRPFYWTTWVLIWLVPPLIIARGLRVRDRYVMGAGAITALLTLVTNKPYLGWARHTWDPMLLGILLSGIALYLKRWLAGGPEGVREGFTARRLSGKDKALLSAASTAFGLASPQPPAPVEGTDVRFGGGDSGGAGATSDF